MQAFVYTGITLIRYSTHSDEGRDLPLMRITEIFSMLELTWASEPMAVADLHLVVLDTEHRDFDMFTGWGFNDESFAGAAGEDEQGAAIFSKPYPNPLIQNGTD